MEWGAAGSEGRQGVRGGREGGAAGREGAAGSEGGGKNRSFRISQVGRGVITSLHFT